MRANRRSPAWWANKLTLLLDQVFCGDDRFRFDVAALATQYSGNCFEDPITSVEGRRLDGFAGALVCGSKTPRRWGILYDAGQDDRRARFTIAHEFGHYLLHRHEHPNGFRCSEDEVTNRKVEGLEREADEFAATLLMPLHKAREAIAPKQKPDLDQLAALADTFHVSLLACILRWLEYTERRAMIVMSNEGFVRFAKSSDPAFRSGRYLRTRRETHAIPDASPISLGFDREDARRGVIHPAGVWFHEPTEELVVRCERYEVDLSILHFDPPDPRFDDEPEPEDLFDLVRPRPG